MSDNEEHRYCWADAAESYDAGWADGRTEHRHALGQVFLLGMLAGIALFALVFAVLS